MADHDDESEWLEEDAEDSSEGDAGSERAGTGPVNEVIAVENSYQVRSVQPCLGGDVVRIISDWRLDTERACVRLVGAHLEFRGTNVELGRALAPQSHLDLLTEHIARERGLEVCECEPDIAAVADRERVFLAQGRSSQRSSSTGSRRYTGHGRLGR